MCPAGVRLSIFSMFKHISLPPFLSPQKTLCHQSEEVRIDVEQELGAGLERCQTGKGGREGRRGGSSLTCQMFMGGSKRTSGLSDVDMTVTSKPYKGTIAC